MKKENIFVIALICIAVGGVYLYNNYQQLSRFSGSESSDTALSIDKDNSITWQSFDQGLKLAKEQDKPVFIYFYADWCTFCTKLKKTTFKDKDVLAYLKEHFISIKVDTDKDRQLAADWRVTGLPTLWFLDSDLQKLNAIPGYIDPERFLQVLKYHFTKAYKDQTFQEFVKVQ